MLDFISCHKTRRLLQVWRLQGGREDDYKASSVASQDWSNKRQLWDAAEMRAECLEPGAWLILAVLN